MATLHKYYVEFDNKIKLNTTKQDSLERSIASIREKITKYFSENKVNELQPTFANQGSFEMGTTINPIPTYDTNDKKLEKYDLDCGVYFTEKYLENNKKAIDTWHSWIYNAVDDHTSTPSNTKKTCVRVNFADGHHIDLPIYYVENDSTKLGHKSKGWIDSKPTDFTNWFNTHASNHDELRAIVRLLKAWKNYREDRNTNVKFPSGFALTILAVENFVQDDNYDGCLLKTAKQIQSSLNYKFECKRPTTPIGEDVFAEFSEKRIENFMKALNSLINDLEKAKDEDNYKKATEVVKNHFGDRFPLGKDQNESDKNDTLNGALAAAAIAPKPYAR